MLAMLLIEDVSTFCCCVAVCVTIDIAIVGSYSVVEGSSWMGMASSSMVVLLLQTFDMVLLLLLMMTFDMMLLVDPPDHEVAAVRVVSASCHDCHCRHCRIAFQL